MNEISAQSAIAVINAGSLLATRDVQGASLSVPVPFQNEIVLFENVRIAGTSHINGIDDIVQELPLESKLRLVREKDSLVDCWAIRVFMEESPIGYVPADCNEVLARLMDGGKALSATLVSKEKLGRWNKLHMEVILDD